MDLDILERRRYLRMLAERIELENQTVETLMERMGKT
jgi:hypothetical protein